MKVKNDFITNSSSTSFVIADHSKKLTKLEVNFNGVKGKFDLFQILDLVSTTNDKNFKKFYIQDLLCEMEEFQNIENLNSYNYDRFKKVVKIFSAIEKGSIIYIFEASDQSGNIIQAGLTKLGLSPYVVKFKRKCVEVLDGQGGY